MDDQRLCALEQSMSKEAYAKIEALRLWPLSEQKDINKVLDKISLISEPDTT